MNERVFKPYAGPPSKLHPNTFKGKITGGGYLANNDRASSHDAPGLRGRVYVLGVGWFWIAGWRHDGQRGRGPYLSLKLNPMSDEDAERYCAAKRHGGSSNDQQQDEYRDGDIPF
jgi:hypothetical protein